MDAMADILMTTDAEGTITFESTLASPALVDGRWYFRTASALLAIGQRKWRPGQVRLAEETRHQPGRIE